jgi:transcriptional regulator with XRE-family HTH domain
MTERQEFGARLRRERELRGLSVSDVVRVTKIPERSVLALEQGLFDELPAEVFVRGFLRSYARCVGLDTDEILGAYHDLVAASAPAKREPSLARPASRDPETRPAAPVAPGPEVTAPPPEAGVDAAAPPAPPPIDEKELAAREEARIFRALADAASGTRRGWLALAVALLVVVATLMLSLLLRTSA